MTIIDGLLVALGGGLGATTRGITGKLVDTKFPWATLIVNIVGSFLIGFVIEVFTLTSYADFGDHLLADGFCGGFTTFSSFSHQTLKMFHSGKTKAGIFNIFLSLLLSLIAVGLGIYAGKLVIS